MASTRFLLLVVSVLIVLMIISFYPIGAFTAESISHLQENEPVLVSSRSCKWENATTTIHFPYFYGNLVGPKNNDCMYFAFSYTTEPYTQVRPEELKLWGGADGWAYIVLNQNMILYQHFSNDNYTFFNVSSETTSYLQDGINTLFVCSYPDENSDSYLLPGALYIDYQLLPANC